MAKQDTVYSLFGLKTPQEVAAERVQQSRNLLSQYASDPFQSAGAAIGLGLGRLFSGQDQELQRAQELEEIARDYQPGNLQNMATTFTRLKEAGAPAETLQRLSADITARSAEVNEMAQQRRARNVGLEYVSKISPELARLAEAGSIPLSEAIQTARTASQKGQGLKGIAETLRERNRDDLAEAVIAGAFEPETALEITRTKETTEVGTLAELTGLSNNLLQTYDPASIRAANYVRLQGLLHGESQQEFALRVSDTLKMKQKEVEPAKAQTFGEFTGIDDSLLDSYSTSSRLSARKIYNDGPKEGESTAQFRKRVLDELLVGLSKEQKARAQELAKSARVATDGRPAMNKFFSVLDTAITGPGAEFLTGVGKLINVLGGDIQGVPESEFIDRLLSAETLNSAQFMSGALSDNDIKFLKKTVGELGASKESLRLAFAQLEAQKLVDQVVYEAYMNTPDKASFNEAQVVREVQPEIYKRVSQARGVQL